MSLTHRTFPIRRDSASGETFSVHIHEPASTRATDIIGLNTWSASLVLANQLHRYPPPFSREPQNCHETNDNSKKTPNGIKVSGTNGTTHNSDTQLGAGQGVIEVLELGAGTGVVGLAAAVQWHAHVILTDLPSVAPNLAKNVALNAELLSSAAARVSAGALDWNDPRKLTLTHGPLEPEPQILDRCREEVHAPRKARIIIAADTVYSEEHPADLSNVILHWLEKHEKARLFLCWPLRIGMIHHFNEFLKLLEEGGLAVKEEGREIFEEESGSERDGKGGWDDEKLHEWSIWGWA